MKFVPLPLAGAFVLEIEPHPDERGFFARTLCSRELASAGLVADFVQTSVSFNIEAGTLRGLHYQADPSPETKIVRCTMGAAFDVLVDLRPRSPSFGRWASVEISAANRKAVYIPAGFAHGFQTLVPDTELLYSISTYYEPALARGLRFDDPSLAIAWPETPRRIMSDRDRALPGLGG